MFRSPISPASFRTSPRSSSRSAISSGDSAAAVEKFVPGIRIPNHHSSHAAKASASAIRTKLSNNARTYQNPKSEYRNPKQGSKFKCSKCLVSGPRFDFGHLDIWICFELRYSDFEFFSSADLFAKEERAKREQQDRHDDENEQVRPVFKQLRAAKNDRAHERDEIGRGKNCAQRIKNPRHRFARKDEAGKEDTRQHEGHGDLQRLHLVFGFGRDEQAEAEKGEDVNQRREQHRQNAAVDRHAEQIVHQTKEQHGHDHANAKIRNELAQHASPPAERTNEQRFERAFL